MKTKWLIEQDVFLEQENIVSEILKQGMYVEKTKFIHSEIDCKDIFDNDCVICYGSTNFIRTVQRKKPWIPGSFCNFSNFECSKYFSYFGPYLLNQDYIMLPLSELKRRRDSFLNNSGLFVRPNSGFKIFSGQVVFKENFEDVFQDIERMHNPETLVVISPCKKIGREWRLVVSNKNIISASLYKENGELNVQKGAPNEVIDYVREIIKSEWEPDPIYTIDVAEDGSSYGIVEINSMSCSGFYKCSLEPIIKSASELALKEFEEFS